VLGPDNKVYVVCGNFVKVPDDVSPNSPHRNYADDLILPRAEDGNGFGAGKKPPGGFVARMDPDGKNCELFASGQRNTYDIAFNVDGELFGFDSDMEWDWGMPWYRPTRVNHIVSGGDYGFREGNAKWPVWYPDSLPTTVDIGIGSPTGVRFGTGVKFPAKYQNAFHDGLVVWKDHRGPPSQRRDYSGSWETFLKGSRERYRFRIRPRRSDVFSDRRRGTQSGLYRVSYVGKEGLGDDRKQDFNAAQARDVRHKLEAFHGKQDPKAIDFAWPHLNSGDRWIRYAARIAIESQPVADWKDRALAEKDVNAGLTALLALSRLGGKETQPALLKAVGKWPLDTLNEEQKLEKLRVIEVSFSRQGRRRTIW
jgi:hypothetical protein